MLHDVIALRVFYISIAIITFILVHRRLKPWVCRIGTLSIDIKRNIQLGVYILFFVVAGNLLFGPIALPSTVDISPVVQLKNVDFNNTANIIKKIEDAKDELGGWTYTVPGESYSYYFLDRGGGGLVDVGIIFYETSEQAETAMKRFPFGSILSFLPGRSVQVSDDIDAKLFWSRVDRHYEALLAVTGRSVNTYIRIDNMVVRISEWRSGSGSTFAIGQTTSKAIKQLCEVLAR